MTEISFTNGEPWSDFYDRMSADDYAFYLLTYNRYLGGSPTNAVTTTHIMSRANIEYINNTDSQTKYYDSASSSGYISAATIKRTNNNKLEIQNVTKIYGVKLK